MTVYCLSIVCILYVCVSISRARVLLFPETLPSYCRMKLHIFARRNNYTVLAAKWNRVYSSIMRARDLWKKKKTSFRMVYNLEGDIRICISIICWGETPTCLRKFIEDDMRLLVQSFWCNIYLFILFFSNPRRIWTKNLNCMHFLCLKIFETWFGSSLTFCTLIYLMISLKVWPVRLPCMVSIGGLLYAWVEVYYVLTVQLH